MSQAIYLKEDLRTIFRFDLAPNWVYHANFITKIAVGSYSTFSPLPVNRRYILCGTFPKVTFARSYLELCSRGARTFLKRELAVIRLSNLYQYSICLWRSQEIIGLDNRTIRYTYDRDSI